MDCPDPKLATQEALPKNEAALVVRAALLAGWMGTMLWLSLADTLPSVPKYLSWDKLQHAGAYAVLAVLAGRFFAFLWRSERLGWGTAAVLSLAFGAILELAQSFYTRTRVGDWLDLLADAVGVALAWLLSLLVARLRRGRVTRRTAE